MLVGPVRVLDVRDLEELLRVGAADPQSRALALAVLHLALEADGLGFALLPHFRPVGKERKLMLVCLRVSALRCFDVSDWEKRLTRAGRLSRCSLRRPCR